MSILVCIIDLIDLAEEQHALAIRLIRSRHGAPLALKYHRRSRACRRAAFWLLHSTLLPDGVTSSGDMTERRHCSTVGK